MKNINNKLNEKERLIYNILMNDNYYSYSSTGIMKRTQFDYGLIVQICKSLELKVNNKINFFKFNEIEYVGFESRRMDYEFDKFLGINKIEKLIKKGFYNKK